LDAVDAFYDLRRGQLFWGVIGPLMGGCTSGDYSRKLISA
jgi:hypothetical protein